MKSAFFNSSVQRVEEVYSSVQRERLKKFGISERVYGRSDLPEMRDVEFIFSTWGMIPLSREEIRRYLPNLRAVFYAAGSVRYFAEPFLSCGVRVFSAWQANAVPVAESVVSQILLANKGFYSLSRLCRKDYAAARDRLAKYPGNFGAKMGILGYGAVARLVVEELRKRDLKIYIFAPDISEEEAESLGIVKTNLEEIFGECDVISNHLADNEQTRGIVNAELISKLKPYSTFLNTGRGAQVDESALVRKLTADGTVTAVLDVTDPEPPEEGSALYALDNVFLTPHSAGSSGNEVHRMAEYMIHEAERFLGGEKSACEVTVDMLKTMA